MSSLLSALYWFLGTGVGLSALLLYVRYNIKKREKLTYQNDMLETTKDYQDEVIEQLSKPQSLNDTIDSLHKGKF